MPTKGNRENYENQTLIDPRTGGASISFYPNGQCRHAKGKWFFVYAVWINHVFSDFVKSDKVRSTLTKALIALLGFAVAYLNLG